MTGALLDVRARLLTAGAQFHGQGTYSSEATKTQYVGQWEAGEKQGRGVMTYPDGSKYDGEWKSGERHGKGSLSMANGDRYVGTFKHGEVRTVATQHTRVICRCTHDASHTFSTTTPRNTTPHPQRLTAVSVVSRQGDVHLSERHEDRGHVGKGRARGRVHTVPPGDEEARRRGEGRGGGVQAQQGEGRLHARAEAARV